MGLFGGDSTATSVKNTTTKTQQADQSGSGFGIVNEGGDVSVTMTDAAVLDFATKAMKSTDNRFSESLALIGEATRSDAAKSMQVFTKWGMAAFILIAVAIFWGRRS